MYFISVTLFCNLGLKRKIEANPPPIKSNGINSYETFNCMKTQGCGWGASGFNDGLVRRRMAEHEVLVTGNFKAAKPTETYRYFQTINTSGKFSEYKSTHWPTQR